MKNKRWTAQTELTEALLNSRERRKWQIALRRYVLEKNKSPLYSPYFGLSIERFRDWIELQFEGESTWQNFGTIWQFEHIIPVIYFDFTLEEELKLCWNFINIQVGLIHQPFRPKKVDLLGAKAYFQSIFTSSGVLQSEAMVKKIEAIELSQAVNRAPREGFLNQHKKEILSITGFTSYEYDQLNTGTSIGQVLEEREVLRKFGG
ncbi:MAG: hypothetical protein ACKVOW_16785 [Chitinophagaceae bacterium]